MSFRSFLLPLFLLGLVACSTETIVSAPPPGTSDQTSGGEPPPAEEEEEPKEPTEEQRAQAKELGEMVAYLRENTAWHAPIDWDKLVSDGEKAIFAGDGSSTAFFAALYGAFVSVPQGHQGLYLASGLPARACVTTMPFACGLPHAPRWANAIIGTFSPQPLAR